MRPRIASLFAIAALAVAGRAHALEPPANLPRYELGITLDPTNHTVLVREKVTWTNRHQRPATELVFNVYPHFQPNKGDIPLLAKTVELLRQDPAAAVDAAGRAGDVNSRHLSRPATRHLLPAEARHRPRRHLTQAGRAG